MEFMIRKRYVVKVIALSFVLIFIWSFFARVPVAVKIEVRRGSDLWGITEAVGEKGKNWPLLWEENKYLPDAGFEDHIIVFANEGDTLVLPKEWKAKKINSLRVRVISGPYDPFWIWILNKPFE